MRRLSTEYTTYSIVLILKTLDLVSTNIVLNLGGTEMNPFVDHLLFSFSIGWTSIFIILTAALLYAPLYLVPYNYNIFRRSGRLKAQFIKQMRYLVYGLNLFPPMWNTLNIILYLRGS